MVRRLGLGVCALFFILAAVGVLFGGPLTARPGHVAPIATELSVTLLDLLG